MSKPITVPVREPESPDVTALVARWRKEQRGYEAGATLATLEPEARAMNRASASVCKRILDDLEAWATAQRGEER